MKYVWRGDGFIDPKTNEPMPIPERDGPCVPLTIQHDIPDYLSPVTGKLVSGRVARREDMARTGCVEYEPPPKDKRFCVTEKWAKRLNRPLKGRDI